MATWYKINASAKLTVRADSLNVRSVVVKLFCNTCG